VYPDKQHQVNEAAWWLAHGAIQQEHPKVL
jgi:hypothetical protein